MKKYSTRDLRTIAKLVKQQINLDHQGGLLKTNLDPKNIWVDITPIIEIRNLFIEGGSGIVNYDKPLYKIIIHSAHKAQIGDLILINNRQLKILKIIDLFQNNLLMAIAVGENCNDCCNSNSLNQIY